MYNRSVLNAGAGANDDFAIISAKNCPCPNGGFRSNSDTSNNYCIGMNIGSGVNVGNLGSESINRHTVMLLMVQDTPLTMSHEQRNILFFPLAFLAYVAQD
jgi:hypothetical protein